MAGAGESPWRRAPAGGSAAASAAPAAAPGGAASALARGWQPSRIALGLALAAVLGHVLMHGLASPLGRAPVAGAALAGAGWAWMAWARTCLRAAGTPVQASATPRLLVDHGPFALGRHPMYLGLAAAMSGLALAGGLPLMALAAAAFLALVAHVHVPHEEAALRRAFGGWYSDYAAQVRRWI